MLAKGKDIIGYYSISAHSVMRDGLPENIPLGGYSDIPFLLLGRLAVDKRHQGQGFGDALIFQTTVDAAEKVGVLGMVVDAKDDKASAFYGGFGFRRLDGTKNRLVLPLSIISGLTSK
jgi:predicted N-acetyltransferase YhbS